MKSEDRKPQNLSTFPHSDNKAASPSKRELRDATDGAKLAVLEIKPLGDKLRAVVDKLNTFSDAVKSITEVHPHAQMAAKILFAVIDLIGKQAESDEKMQELLELLEQVYSFVEDSARVNEMLQAHQDLLKALAIRTIKLAGFIERYAEKQNFWKRLSQNALADVNSEIQRHKAILEDLMKAIQQRGMLQIQLDTQFICAESLAKQCLPGTRIGPIDDILNWAMGKSDDPSPVLWLSGGAGTGKSTIAHTVAHLFRQMGHLGSFFCFDQNLSGDRRHEKVFTTISRDLADLHPMMRDAVTSVVQALPAAQRSSSDVLLQWKNLILPSFAKLSAHADGASLPLIGPILIIVDALDESGDSRTRESLLSIFAGGKDGEEKLPPNVRILLISRPLDDIYDALAESRYVTRKSMDEIPETSTRLDIAQYIKHRLDAQLKGFLDDGQVQNLVDASHGLFQWTYLACEYILGHHVHGNRRGAGLPKEKRFKKLCSPKRSGKAERGDDLLYSMYTTILKELFDMEDDDIRNLFLSVMSQILVTREPLPRSSLNAMRDYMSGVLDEDKDISPVIDHMGPLLTGVSNPSIPLRPIHTSFYDYLTSKSASGDFFVDVEATTMRRGMAQSTLAVMKKKLRFSIAGVKTSYHKNTNDALAAAAEEIPPELQYACKHWSGHLTPLSFDDNLAKSVTHLLYKQFPFWLEVLSRSLRTTSVPFSRVITWLQEGDGKLAEFARDALQFIQLFATPISQS
ncbi:hypothetical protein BDN72DRAFT_898084, partial [Pluteus cervinus]